MNLVCLRKKITMFTVLIITICVFVSPVFTTELNNDQVAFFDALKQGDKKSIEVFLSKGISVNIVNNDGETPLTLASRHGYQDIGKFLISKGANVNTQNRKGETALMLAAKGNYWDFVTFLIESSADVNKKDYMGRTALWYAKNCMLDCRASEKILIENGATLETEDIYKQTFPCGNIASELTYEFPENKKQLLFFAGVLFGQGFLRDGDYCRPVLTAIGGFSQLKGIMTFEKKASSDYPDIVLNTKAPGIGDIKTVYAWNGDHYELNGMRESMKLNSEALRLVKEGKIQEAINILEEARGLALLPFSGLTANAEVLNNLGFAYHEMAKQTKSMANYEKAVKYYKETIEVDKRRWQVYLNYADYYAEVNNPRHAIENYEELLELNPSYKYADKIKNKIISLRQKLEDAQTPADDEMMIKSGSKSSTANIKLKFKPDKIISIRVKGKKSDIDLNDFVNAEGNLEGKVIFSTYKKDNLYLLLDIYGPSWLPGGLGYCGAGEEYNMVWLKLDSQLKPLDIKSALYESCFETIFLDPEPDEINEPRYQIRKNALKFNYISFSKSIYYSFYYDNNKPKAGFIINSSPY